MKSKWLYRGGVSAKTKLDQIINDYTNEREKIEISQELYLPLASGSHSDQNQLVLSGSGPQPKDTQRD